MRSLFVSRRQFGSAKKALICYSFTGSPISGSSTDPEKLHLHYIEARSIALFIVLLFSLQIVRRYVAKDSGLPKLTECLVRKLQERTNSQLMSN